MPRWFLRRPKLSASDSGPPSASALITTSSGNIFPSGIKLLYDSENSVVDIIFIHGITGHREKTWTAKNAAAPWPQTLLPSRVPNARILTFGYDSSVVDWRSMVSKNRIMNHSMNLLTTVATYREDSDTSDRPIIFVCHSLGGLICEDALTTARQRPEGHLRNIVSSTCGIIFLGTPHHGAGLAQWAKMLATSFGLLRQTNAQILAALASDSEILARIQDSFHTMIRSQIKDGHPLIEITCFYEELPLLGVGVVVPSHSAILPGYVPIGIRRNHIDMTKFEHEGDPGFIAVVGELRRWIKELTVPSGGLEPGAARPQPEQQVGQQYGSRFTDPLGNSTVTISGAGNQGPQLGQNYGTVSANFVLPPERPDTPPVPTYTVPFRRDLDFVDRGDILNQIHQKCSTPASRVALVGLGGIGKSQLAIEYSYQLRERSPQTWVFWVHASTVARFEEGYRAIANTINIPGREDPKADVLQLVKSWMCNESKGKWVMILDNADDVSIFFNVRNICKEMPVGNSGTTEPLLAAYLPESPNGSILVTTRDEDTAFRLTGGDRDIVRIGPMEEGHAFALLQKKLGEEIDKDAATELGAVLGFIPLAITQAAAYIRQRGPRCSLELYIKNFHRNDQSKVSLLEYDTGDLRRDLRVSNSVIITWQMSFDHIRQSRPSAANLLSLMSFFDRQGIPVSLLRPDRGTASSDGIGSACNDSGRDATSEYNINNEFEDDIVVLKNFSLIAVNVDGDTFEMHNLVQLSTRKWLEENGQLEKWKQDYVARLCGAYPPGNYENWKICQSLFAHAEAVLEQEPTGQESVMEWALLLYNAGWYAWAKGSLKEAEKMLQKATSAREKFLGLVELETLAGVDLLGQVLLAQGRYKEAEEMHQRALDGYNKALGQEHPDTLASIANLASTYWNQGRWKEAEDLEVQVIETRKRVLGQEHPSTLVSIANLASTYWNQGRWKEAEDLYVQVIETTKRVLGQEHPDTLASIANLASTYRNQGRWKEAEDLGVQVMETTKRVLGQEHPDTLASIANIASTYWNQGRWKEAEDLDVQVIETRKRVLGQEHPDTLASIANLASTYRNQGRWKEAEDLGVQVMETTKRVLGQEHPDTLASIANLASTYQNQGRWKEAEDLGVQVMETTKRVLGQEHPDTLTSMNNLALTLKLKGQGEKAVALMAQCVNLRKVKLGVDHPHTKSSLEALNEWQR